MLMQGMPRQDLISCKEMRIPSYYIREIIKRNIFK